MISELQQQQLCLKSLVHDKMLTKCTASAPPVKREIILQKHRNKQPDYLSEAVKVSSTLISDTEHDLNQFLCGCVEFQQVRPVNVNYKFR